VKIIKNLPSFRVEEVGPMASCEPNATLLAPEEVFSRNKAPPMAKDERTLTDKRRERRKKKIKQR
jgi:U3 small nucleolar RNA-associated protein MPP10